MAELGDDCTIITYYQIVAFALLQERFQMALYRTLEVKHNCDFAEIRKSFAKKCIVNHPDKGGSHTAMVAILVSSAPNC